MILLYTFLVVNLIAFVLMGYDKKLAQNNKRRISEKTLLAFVSIGGTFGSGLGMLLFRHKTAKTSYLLKFWLIVAVQILIICFYIIKSK
ncbi:DUF1294 domain-containing protein [Flavobacterium sp. 5]|uniref:DUF1294 domain-containing protein n=1 Tax=Flavobacterium sp. 5 TaxID=2035199 RepID=UPI000C2CD8CD|nr:DUF1294 domain-containing protein [Flavobacterium sp. 5]PKB16736.1 uncharacterized membrane protein YsdA (DUF1294 family) [Flavobacterium sp. 5]